MANKNEDQFMEYVDTINSTEGWTAELQGGHRQTFWVVKNPAGEMARFPQPVTYQTIHPKSFRLRAQTIGFPWEEALTRRKAELKAAALANAKAQAAQERKLADDIRERLEQRQAGLAAASGARKAKWVRPRRYTLPLRITPEWALPYVTDQLGPSGREPIPPNPVLVAAYAEAILAGLLEDVPITVVLDWNDRLLHGAELLTAVVETDRHITADVVHDADPDAYAALNIAHGALTGVVPEAPPRDESHTQEPGVAEELDESDIPADDPTAADETGEEADTAPGAQDDAAPGISPTALRSQRALAQALVRYADHPTDDWPRVILSPTQLAEAMLEYPNLDRAVRLGNRLTAVANRDRPCLSPLPAWTFAYLALEGCPTAEEDGEFAEFIDGALRGYQLSKGDPRGAMHDFLYRAAKPEPGKAKRTNGTEQLMVALKCWNAWCDGSEMRLADARWHPDDGTVPFFRDDEDDENGDVAA